jgi:hypothetical protein
VHGNGIEDRIVSGIAFVEFRAAGVDSGLCNALSLECREQCGVKNIKQSISLFRTGTRIGAEFNVCLNTALRK